MVCFNFEEVCDRVTVEIGLMFSFDYWCFLKLGLFPYSYLLTVGVILCFEGIVVG